MNRLRASLLATVAMIGVPALALAQDGQPLPDIDVTTDAPTAAPAVAVPSAGAPGAGRRWRSVQFHPGRDALQQHPHRCEGNRAHRIALGGGHAPAARAERRHPGHVRQFAVARHRLSRLRLLADPGHAAGHRRLSERRARQRSLRRHDELGHAPDLRHRLDGHDLQQSGVRPQRARRRGQHQDEGRLHLSGRKVRDFRRLVRARPGRGRLRQAGWQFRLLRRARRRDGRRLPRVRRLHDPPLLWRSRLSRRRQ